MPLAPETTAPRRFQFSLRTILIAMVWVALFCAVRAMVFRADSMGDAVSRAMWGRTFIAIVGGAWGAMSARRLGARRAKIVLQGTLQGTAAATIVLTAIAVEVATGFGEFYPDYFQWSRDWLIIVQLVLYVGIFLGAIIAAIVATLWLLRPSWRYAVSTTLLTLAGAFWLWLSIETDRARHEKEALEQVTENILFTVQYEPAPDRWFIPGPTVVSYLQELSRERVFETVVEVRMTGGVYSMGIGKRDDWSQLPKLKNLRKLILEYRGPDHAEFVNIAKLQHLEELWLMGFSFTDADLECLHGVQSLRVVALTRTGATPAGEARLKQALPHCRVEHRPEPPPSTDPDAAPARPSAAP